MKHIIRGVPEGNQHKGSPWYVIPADDKDNARVIVSQIILDTLNDLEMSYPPADKAYRKELQSARKLLASQVWSAD